MADTTTEAVADSVRRTVMRWANTRVNLIADANAGATSISVFSTRRFVEGDQIVIHNDNEDMENMLEIASISGRNTINLTTPLKWSWPLSAGGHVMKTFDNQYIKAVYFGEPDVITDLPAVTVNVTTSASEFLTIRATKERYNIEIGVFVAASSQEEGDRFLRKTANAIQFGLKRNFYPLLNNYQTTTLTADIVASDFHIKVADTSIFTPGQMIMIEDEYNIEVHAITSVCDSSTLQLAQVIEYDYDKDATTVIKPRRWPYNSWPSDIQYGKIYKGTLLKAGVISYFIEEMEDQFYAGFGDPQLQ